MAPSLELAVTSLVGTAPPTLAIFGLPQGAEIIVILFVGLLLFGRRLPEVGRSLGQGIVEFKKGLKGVTDDIDQSADQPPQRQQQRIPDQSAADASRKVEEASATKQRNDGH